MTRKNRLYFISVVAIRQPRAVPLMMIYRLCLSDASTVARYTRRWRLNADVCRRNGKTDNGLTVSAIGQWRPALHACVAYTQGWILWKEPVMWNYLRDCREGTLLLTLQWLHSLRRIIRHAVLLLLYWGMHTLPQKNIECQTVLKFANCVQMSLSWWNDIKTDGSF